MLTVMAIAIAVGAVVALVGVAEGLQRSVLAIWEGSGIDLMVVRSGAARRLTSGMDDSLVEKIEQIPGVKDTIPGLTDMVSFNEYGLYVVPVSGLIPETVVFDHMTMLEGRQLKKGDERKIMLGVALAEAMEKEVGDDVELVEDETYEVVGIFETNTSIENGSVVIALGELQELMGRPDQVTGISVITDAPHDEQQLDRIIGEIEALDNGVKAMTTKDQAESITEFQTMEAMAWLTSVIAVVIGFLGIMNTMIMSVQERTREIGILRAIGWRRGRIMKMIMTEALVLSLIGAVVGTVGAVVLVRVLTQTPMVNGLIEGHVDAGIVGWGFLIAVIVGLLGGIIPAYSAAKMMPTTSLRHE